jgi:hypothetical protein
MFKISSNFMDKVFKIIQLLEYHFSTNFTQLLYAFAVQIGLYGENSLSDT